MIKITEAPRDAMQGIIQFIPTSQKAALINELLKVGFDLIDFGSFVSPKAIPQLRDTAEVISKLDLTGTDTKLMAIVGNLNGGQQAAAFDEVSYIGFPFSFSETFLKLNLKSDVDDSRKRVEDLYNLCIRKGKNLLVYISMAFGNPYGDPWSIDHIIKWVGYFENLGVGTISLSDIIGCAGSNKIEDVYGAINREMPNIEVGLHLHTGEKNWYEKVDAAYNNGCRRFDGVMSGMGGCPMSGYELVGNLNTRNILEYCDKKAIPNKINRDAFEKAYLTAVKTYATSNLLR
nr:hydroxymethylglutaryl-CoA lyase [Bacteroidota bacterium]